MACWGSHTTLSDAQPAALRILAPIDHNGQKLSGKNSEIERVSPDDTGNAD